MPETVLDPLVEGYLGYLRDVKKLVPRSIVDARCSLKKAGEALGKMRPGKAFWELRLEDFTQWVGNRRKSGHSVQTIVKDLSHLRQMIDYAWHSGRTDRNVLEGFHLEDEGVHVPPAILELNEAEKLVSGCGQKTRAERQKRLIILLLYGCGLRTHELCALNAEDIDMERQEVFVKHGKGGIQRRIPVPVGVWTELLAYMTERGKRSGAFFKTDHKRKRIRSINLLDIVSEAARNAGIGKKVTPKVLRHSFASHLMDAGVDVSVISVLMGHRSPIETGVYLHALKNKKKIAVKKLRLTTVKEV